MLRNLARHGRTKLMSRLKISDSMPCVGSVYGVFPQYVIGFDLVNCLTYNVRKI